MPVWVGRNGGSHPHWIDLHLSKMCSSAFSAHLKMLDGLCFNVNLWIIFLCYLWAWIDYNHLKQYACQTQLCCGFCTRLSEIGPRPYDLLRCNGTVNPFSDTQSDSWRAFLQLRISKADVIRITEYITLPGINTSTFVSQTPMRDSPNELTWHVVYQNSSSTGQNDIFY